MQNKKITRLTTGITALALTCSLSLTGCDYAKKDKFYFHYSLNGEAYVKKSDYISNEYIYNYYVIELHYKGLNRNSIYIANRFQYTSGVSKYTNIFTNDLITYDDNENNRYEFIKVTPLIDLLEEYNLIKDKYTYEDMQEIYQIIKENYVFSEIAAKTRILEKEK